MVFSSTGSSLRLELVVRGSGRSLVLLTDRQTAGQSKAKAALSAILELRSYRGQGVLDPVS